MKINYMINKLYEAHPAFCRMDTRSFSPRLGVNNSPSSSIEVGEMVFYATNLFKSVRRYRELHSA